MALDDNLISYWKMDETSGNRADSKGTNTLVDGNTVTYDTGKISNAAKFAAATTEYLEVADNASLAVTTGFTISMWIYITGDVGNAWFVSKYGLLANPYGEYGLRWRSNGSDMQFFIQASGGNGYALANITSNLNYNAWNHIVMQYDGSQSNYYDRVWLYRNGVQKTYNSWEGDTDVVTSITRQSWALDFGRDPNLGQYLTGRIDEVGFWSRVLTSDEIALLYNSGSGLEYPFPSAPNTPTNSSPSNGATNISRNPTLTSSAFSDPDAGNTHKASQWQVATDSGFTGVVWDSGTDTTNKTSTTVNTSNGTFSGALSGKTRLASNTTYYWHVRHQDNTDRWSSYS